MSRGRLSSWALGAAFVLVVGLAAADAVRKRESSPAATASSALDERLRERLQEDGVRGTLLVTAPAGCRTTAWSLPELERVSERPCAPPAPQAVPWLRAPAAEVERAGRMHLNAPLLTGRLRVLLDDVAQLAGGRAAALLSLRIAGRPDLGGNQLIAFFEDGRLFAQASFFRGDLRSLTASPSGEYVAALPGFVLRANGSAASLPQALVQARALAWSPDGRWLALAQRASVVLLSLASLEQHDRDGSSLRTIDLPLEARELEWR
jgi:hypothetical protein